MRRAGTLLALLLGLSACQAPAPAPRDPAADVLLARAEESFAAHDFSNAELKFRDVLNQDLSDRQKLHVIRRIGECLREQARYSEARETFEQVVCFPLHADEERLSSYESNQKGWAQAGIAECYEAEERWEEALQARLECHQKFPIRDGCGNCDHDRRERELEAIARCIRRLQAH